ncbi:hypothetical protein GCM10009646_90560 [Streptomyces aureus]
MKPQDNRPISNTTPVKRNYPGVTNLLAACQLCHLRIDHGHHKVTRSLTLAARATAAGQLALLPATALIRTEPPTPPRPGPHPRPRSTSCRSLIPNGKPRQASTWTPEHT